MVNKTRNEMEIKLGSKNILLRPTFENVASMENDLGGVAYLSWKYSRGIKIGDDGKIDKDSIGEVSIKSLPPISEAAKIIYYNQASVNSDDPNQKKLSLDEIWELVSAEGVKVCRTVTFFIAGVTAGNKMTETDESEVSEEEKKS